MSLKIQPQQISIADQLLKQLQDQYFAVQQQNIIMPKQNIEPEEDPENPYQPLDFDDFDDNQQNDLNEEQVKIQKSWKEVQNKERDDQNLKQQENNIQTQLQENEMTKVQSNPQIKQQLMEVLPTNQQIFTNLPHKDFEIDQDKIKNFALQMDINQPEWLNNQNLCKKRLQQLFMKQKSKKTFTKPVFTL